MGTEFDAESGLVVLASASKDRKKATVSIVNKDKNKSVDVKLQLSGAEGNLPGKATALLTGDPEDENSFEEPEKVMPRAWKVEGKGSEWSVVCEPFSLTVITFEHGE